METSLYQTLGISETASPGEVKAALRALVRDYHCGNLQGHAEDTLRFINHACSILTSAGKRAEYDLRLAEFRPRAAVLKDTTADFAAEMPSPTASPITHPAAISERASDTKAVRDRKSSRAGKAPADRLSSAGRSDADKPLIIRIGGSAAFRMGGAKLPKPPVAQFRRAPQQVSGENPSRRLIARLIDYGLWGLAADTLLRTLANHGVIAPDLHWLLRTPLVAVIAIPASWVPVEIALLNFLRTTPGKWLTDVQLRFSASDPSLREGPGARPWEVIKRSFRVWARGTACGIPLFNLIAMSKARRQLLRMKETSWDFDGDCLVTHVPLDAIHGTAASAAALLILWLYGTAWMLPLTSAAQDLQSSVQQAYSGVDARIIEPLLDKFEEPQIPARAPVSAVETSRSNTTAASVEIEKFSREAQRLSSKRDWKGLVKHCRDWSISEPEQARGWHCLGTGYDRLADYPRAVAALKKAAQLAPGDQTIKNNLMASFRAQYRQPAEARQASRNAEQ